MAAAAIPPRTTGGGGGTGTGTKVFNDAVHGHMELSAVAAAVVDTPQYQRLRDVRQLGAVYLVFPSAGHARFEHCLGTGHLARTFVRMLAAGQPEAGISEADALCVELAGLCHDLGHGIMSHLFDRKFIPRAVPGCRWEHEHASIGLLDHLLRVNPSVPAAFAAAGLTVTHCDTAAQLAAAMGGGKLPEEGSAAWEAAAAAHVDSDLHFIKELILGSPDEAPDGWVWRGAARRGLGGRGGAAAMAFLFDIVANKRNSIDVDKLDYFARDCSMLNVAIPFDAGRLMRFSRVVHLPDGVSTIGFAAKEAWNVHQLFASRYSLHKRAYQHRVARIAETMMTEALLAADDVVRVTGTGGVQLRMSETIHDMEAYTRLSDYLLRVILHSTDPALAPARTLLHRIECRDLYPFIAETLWVPGGESKPGDGSAAACSPTEPSPLPLPPPLPPAAPAGHIELSAATTVAGVKRVRGGGGGGGGGDASQVPPTPPSEAITPEPVAAAAGGGGGGGGGGSGAHGAALLRRISSMGAGDAGAPPVYARRRAIRERDSARITRELVTLHAALHGDAARLSEDNLLVEVICINMGAGSRNPVDAVTFFHTDKVTGQVLVGPIGRDQISAFVPAVFEEQYVRLYVRNSAAAPQARVAFDAWCAARRSGVPLPFSPPRPAAKRSRTTCHADGGDEGEGEDAGGACAGDLTLPLAGVGGAAAACDDGIRPTATQLFVAPCDMR